MNSKLDPKAEMTVGIVQVEPNQTNPYHMHPNSAEYVHVLSGSCEQLVGDKWAPMKAGDTIRFPKAVPHQARTGKEPCRMMIIYDTGERQMVVLDQKK
jgi:quercetin dioxygenase-like cupin family protein